jgi:hypothetical protein
MRASARSFVNEPHARSLEPRQFRHNICDAIGDVMHLRGGFPAEFCDRRILVERA